MIIADENVERYWIELLRKNNFDVISIAENFSGITDSEVVQIAKSNQATLLTEDKDFGEMVFAHQTKNLSVIFLRYDQPNYSQIENQLLLAVNKFVNQTDNYFITITKLKTRVTKI
ncbi:MAG: hypothetical protein RL708_1606 [Bacteroidota bacterium]|jgi:predicted nuclease of predicted toxin-antitoxin system